MIRSRAVTSPSQMTKRLSELMRLMPFLRSFADEPTVRRSALRMLADFRSGVRDMIIKHPMNLVAIHDHPYAFSFQLLVNFELLSLSR